MVFTEETIREHVDNICKCYGDNVEQHEDYLKQKIEGEGEKWRSKDFNTMDILKRFSFSFIYFFSIVIYYHIDVYSFLKNSKTLKIKNVLISKIPVFIIRTSPSGFKSQKLEKC